MVATKGIDGRTQVSMYELFSTFRNVIVELMEVFDHIITGCETLVYLRKQRSIT